MDLKDPKGRIIRRFLDFVSHYVPIPDARLATLGGLGIEAKIWEEMNVTHGWLIELNHRRRTNLIRKNRFKITNRLKTFDSVLAGHGDEGFIDGFHLDLCGTFANKVVHDFAPILPHMFKSRGKCLAITVADQRLIIGQRP
jgi:hypothetical protein